MNDPQTLNVVVVSLDVTGTLIHSPRLAEIYSAVLERHGTLIPASVLEDLIPTVWNELDCRVEGGVDRFGAHPDGATGWWNDYLQRICDYRELPHPGPFAAAELYDRFGQADAWEVYPDVLPALDELARAGFRLIALSNWDPRLPLVLERLDLARHFEAIVYSAEVGFEKPQEAIFRQALEAVDLRAGSVVHVGDRKIDDVEGATAVGMHALLVDRKGSDGDLVDLHDLPACLRLVEPMLS
jgi:putative hydrolase of the HAD superfamily